MRSGTTPHRLWGLLTITAGSEGLTLEMAGQKIALTALIINGWRLPKE